MKITLQSTDRIVKLQSPAGPPDLDARVWEGHTEGGAAIIAYIPRVAVPQGADFSEVQRELDATPHTKAEFPVPTRLVL